MKRRTTAFASLPILGMAGFLIMRAYLHYAETDRKLSAISANLPHFGPANEEPLNLEWETKTAQGCGVTVLTPKQTKVASSADTAAWSWEDQTRGVALKFDCRRLRPGELVGKDPVDEARVNGMLLEKSVEQPPLIGKERWYGGGFKERKLRTGYVFATLSIVDPYLLLSEDQKARFFSSLVELPAE